MTVVPKIISIGNTCLDIILRYTNRLPQWGTELFLDETEWRLGGQAANFAVACCALGYPSQLVSNVGSDQVGKRLRTELKSENLLNTKFLQTTKGETGFAVSLLRSDGERLFLTFLGHQSLFSTKPYMKRIIDNLDARDMVHVSGYYMLPRLKTELPDVLRLVRETGARTSFDPGWPPFGFSKPERKNLNAILPWFDFFEPNETELLAMTQKTRITPAITAIRRQFNGIIALKRGKKGCTVLSGEKRLTVKALHVHALDTTGAGDVFDAGFLTGILRNDPLDVCASRGNRAAAIFISKGMKNVRNELG